MSFVGHVDWKRMLIGPAWPFAIIGKPSVPAVAAVAVAAFRKRRRPPVFCGVAAARDLSLIGVLQVRCGTRRGVVWVPALFVAWAPRSRWVETDGLYLSLIHISEPTRLLSISYAVFC